MFFHSVEKVQKEVHSKEGPAADGSSPSPSQPRKTLVASASAHADHVWHYDDEYMPAGSKPASASSPEHLDGVVSNGFVAVNLSSCQQEVDSKEWVIVDKERDLKDYGSNGKAGLRVTGSPSEEEAEVLQVLEESPQDGSPKLSSWTDNKGHNKPDPRIDLDIMVSSNVYMDKLDVLSGAAGQLLPATPTSPMEAQAEGAITPVRNRLWKINRLESKLFISLTNTFFLAYRLCFLEII